MVSRAGRRAVLAALVAVAAGVPSAAAHAAPDERGARVAEVATLYGHRAGGAADVVSSVPARAAGRLLGVRLREDRPVDVFVLRGRARLAPFGPIVGGTPRRCCVLAGALDRRTGAAIAVQVLARRPRLAGLGPTAPLRLPAPGTTTAVVGSPFDSALSELRGAGYRVSVQTFPRLSFTLVQPGLGHYVVAQALPLGRRTVRLRLVIRSLPVGSPVRGGPQETTTVPDLVGMSYAAAMAGVPGLYIRIGRIGALRPNSSRLGLDAFVVRAQRPAAGTVVPAYGERIPNGVDLGPSIVTLTLGVRGPGPAAAG